MASDSPIPLATAVQMQSGAFADLVQSFSVDALNDIMIEATRACETECQRRLAPFTAHTESHRLGGIDPDEYSDSLDIPMDIQGTIGQSYANALGANSMVRHVWLNEYAPLYPEYWSYSNVAITIIRSYGGSQLETNLLAGPEIDSGHVWFQLGQFIPVASFARCVYSGGYSTVPADLVRACKYMAAAVACRELDPLMAGAHGHDPDNLEAVAMRWLTPYMRS